MVGGRYLKNGGTKKTHVGIHTAYRGIKGLACNSVKDKQIALLIVVHVGLHCWLSPSSLFVVVSRHRFSSSSLSSWLLCNWLSSSSGMAIMMMTIIIIIIMDGCCTWLRLFVCLFIHSFVHPFVCSFIHSFIRLSVRSFVCLCLFGPSSFTTPRNLFVIHNLITVFDVVNVVVIVSSS